MNISLFSNRNQYIFLFAFLFFSLSFYAQNDTLALPKQRSYFWQHVHYGGGLALNFGSGYSNVTIAPSAIYGFNPKFALGTGLQYGHTSQNNPTYNSNIYGISVIGLYNPVPFMQLSVEVEEVNANNKFQDINGNFATDNFWATNLFLGLGYHSQNVTFGGRFNVFYNKNKDIYGDAFMPFVRVYF